MTKSTKADLKAPSPSAGAKNPTLNPDNSKADGISSSKTEQFRAVFEAVLRQLEEKEEKSKQSSSSRTAPFGESAVGRFQNLLELHKLVSQCRFGETTTVPADSSPQQEMTATASAELAQDVCMALRQTSHKKPVLDLLSLLSGLHFKSMLKAHDDVANRRYEPMLPDVPHQVDEDEGLAVKIVRLEKRAEPLGATIKVEEDGAVVIARVICGGVADKSGCIQVGDQLIEVNGVYVAGKDPKAIVKLLNGANGNVTFKLIPRDIKEAEESPSVVEQRRQASVRPPSAERTVRTLFAYKPAEDQMHPCPEAGLQFSRGDVLGLLDDSDEHWWQARLVKSSIVKVQLSKSSASVGLIPSQSLLGKKALSMAARERKSSKTSLSSLQSPKTQHSAVRKLMYEARLADEFDAEQPKTYEDVALLEPTPGLIRTIVLIGAPGVGRNELKRRLQMLNPDRFATTVPHTSRPPRESETDGVDYHFVSRSEMEEYVRRGEFLEYGEYRDNLYGTVVGSVTAIVEQGRTPVLTPHPQALKALCRPRLAEHGAPLRPFVVFVKPPPFPLLKETRTTNRARSSFDGTYSRGFTDEELEQMIATSRKMEQLHGHYFDCELVNGRVENVFRELCQLLHRIETEPQWVRRHFVLGQ